ncbi:hypothetical protein [Microbacterium sp.]|uniref:hypothetical protein n=1 Tax=Microbacterium sp. TaxID=51671 RepID=UPI003F992E58
MNRAQKIATAVSVLVVAGIVALAAPPVVAATSWAAERFAPATTPVATPVTETEDLPADLPDGYVSVGNGTFIPAGGPGDCTASAWIHVGGMSASLAGELVDQGPRDLAAGTVGLDDKGNIVTYTVAPGDAPYAISDRFCIANPLSIALLNHTRTIQPGQVLLLRPDPDVPWVPFFNPVDAPSGFQQIPYQQAIYAMGVAADADDVDAMRAIWADGLSDMFINPEHVNVIAEALDVGDLDVLRQMFS